MGEIMGMGSTHWPAMIRPDDAGAWPFLRTLANDPRVPEALQDPSNWPEGVRREYVKESPYRVVLYASGGWSHGFLVEKNHCLWPDIEADRHRCQELQQGREAAWKDLTVAEIEAAGQQELMSWICVAGAMHELGQKGEVVDYLETAGVFNSGKCLAVWRP